MPVLIALQYLTACLVLGLGLFLATEAAYRLRQRVDLGDVGLGDAASFGGALVGLTMALLGGYWAGSIVPVVPW